MKNTPVTNGSRRLVDDSKEFFNRLMGLVPEKLTNIGSSITCQKGRIIACAEHNVALCAGFAIFKGTLWIESRMTGPACGVGVPVILQKNVSLATVHPQITSKSFFF